MEKKENLNEKELDEVLKQIQKTFGKGAVMKLGERPAVDVDVIPSGSLLLDEALGIGGYPKGRIIEIFGPESSGKTTLALSAIAECQKAGGRAGTHIRLHRRRGKAAASQGPREGHTPQRSSPACPPRSADRNASLLFGYRQAPD